MLCRSFLLGRVPIVLGCVAVLGLAGLGGCNPPGTDTVTITDVNSGGMVELRTGQTLRVLLASNPSTGYGWDPASFDSTVLEQQRGVEYFPDNAPPGVTGVGGTICMSFQAVGAGRTTLRLIYHQPFGYDALGVETFEVTVVVSN